MSTGSKWRFADRKIMACALVVFAQAAAADETLRVSGTGSGGMKLVATAFMAANSGVRVDVLRAMGSSGGISALTDERLEVVVSNRMPNAAELAKAPLLSTEYAGTPFIVAVHRDLGVRSLTSAQLADLYDEGAVTFPNGKRARPVLRLSDATDTQLLQSFSPEVAKAVDAVATRRGMLNANTDSEAADLVETTAGAFGVSTLALIESEKRALVALAVDGKVPSVANLANGSYPYYKSLFVIVGPKSGPNAQKFLAFVQSAAERELLSANGHWMR